MPRVPTYDTPQVAPQAAPAPYRQPAAIENQDSARQMGAAGAALQDVGAQLTQEEVNAQGMANQVLVDGARNKLIEEKQRLTFDPNEGFANKLGRDALQPDPLGRSLTQQYGEQLQDKINQLSAGLGNDAQRRVFAQQAAEVSSQFGGDVQRHMLQQFRSYGLETQQGTIKLAADAAKQSWDDPDQIAAQVHSASAAVWKAGQINGEPGNLTEAKMKETTSAIHAGVIQSALDNNNPAYALAYINSKKGEMTADDLLKANALVKVDMRARVATSTAQGAMDSLKSRLAPTDTDRVLNITMQSESSGNRDAQGRFVPGQGTAKGDMQVMDATNGNPGYGVTPAKDDSPEERSRVGRDYMLAMVKNYGGDMSKAWAAYNWGPGNVDDAVKQYGANWLTHAPQETQAYVTKNVAALQKGATAPVPSQQDVHDAIRTQLGPNADPKLLQAALAEGTRLYADFQADRKAKGENAVTAAQQWLINNHGNTAGMPPALSTAITQYAPDKYDNLMDFGKKIATGGVATNMNAYYDAVANTDELAKMPQSVFNHFVMTNFSPEDGKHIAALRQEEIDGESSNGAGSINRPALNTALNSRLEAIGINPTPKDLAEKARVGSIQKFVTDGIFAQQKQLGRKMTAQEVGDFVDQTMARNVTFRNTFLGATTGTSQTPLMGLKVSDIPSESLTAIRTALAARGNNRPTDDQILRTYWTAKNAK
ncbi:MAG: transglycosylase SLT domain-containing protein [Telluria sp.]